MVVEVKDPYDYLNLSFARSKADTVMRRVGRSLGYVQEPKKDSIVSFDFDKTKNEENVDNNVVDNTTNVNTDVVDNSDINTNVNTDSNNSSIKDNSYDILTSLNNYKNNESSIDKEEVNKNIDNDFWSVNDDIFPNMNANEEYKVDSSNSAFKLNSPLEFGGSDENRN